MKQKPALDLWGPLPIPGASRTPADVLREQAEVLGTKTKNVLIGSLDSQIAFSSEKICIRFVVRAPALEYRTSLFEIEHAASSPYPCVVRSTLATVNTSGKSYRKAKYPTADSEPDLVEMVKNILQSPEVQRIIAGLLETSRVTEEPKQKGGAFAAF